MYCFLLFSNYGIKYLTGYSSSITPSLFYPSQSVRYHEIKHCVLYTIAQSGLIILNYRLMQFDIICRSVNYLYNILILYCLLANYSNDSLIPHTYKVGPENIGILGISLNLKVKYFDGNYLKSLMSKY